MLTRASMMGSPLTDNYESLTEAVEKYVPQPIVRDLLMVHGSSLTIAGGFVRSTLTGGKPRDVDMWMTTSDDYVKNDIVATFKRIAEGALYKTKNAINVKLVVHPDSDKEAYEAQVQLMTELQFNTIDDVLKSFDLTICQAAIFYNRIGNHFDGVCSSFFWDDLNHRALHYTFPEKGISSVERSLRRCIKYRLREYVMLASSPIEYLLEEVDDDDLILEDVQRGELIEWMCNRDREMPDWVLDLVGEGGESG